MDDGERAFFDEHGWLIVRGAASAARVAELEREFDRVFPQAYQLPHSAGEVWQIMGQFRAFPSLTAHLADPAIARRAARLLGAERVQLLQDTLLCKPPRGGRVDWHQDYTYTGYLEPARALSMRLALAPCTETSGCLRVVDGSHRWGFRAPLRILSDPRVSSSLAALPPELAARVAGATRVLELEPGDLSVHHCLTLHASFENHSERPRKTIITHIFDSECRLVPERLPAGAHEHFATDAEGRLSASVFQVL